MNLTHLEAMHQIKPPMPSYYAQFTPKLVTVFREGYGWRDLRADAVAGLTVAVVTLPLSMGIAVGAALGVLFYYLRRQRNAV